MTRSALYPTAMSEQDAMFWNLDRYASLRSTVLAISVLDGPPDRERTMQKLEVATRLIPRLRQRVVELPRMLSTPIWQEVEHFDLDYHVRWIAAPGDGSLQGVVEFAAAMAMQAFDFDRPLWEFTIVEGLEDGRAAVIQKLHHTITDGAAGVQLMTQFYDLKRRASGSDLDETAMPSHEPAATRGVLELSLDALRRSVRRQPSLARQRLGSALDALSKPIDSALAGFNGVRSVADQYLPGPGPLSPLMTDRSENIRLGVLSVRVDELKNAAHAADCKLNDAFLAALAGGWRLYHGHYGVTQNALQLSFPINLRTGDECADTVGNQVSVARGLLPVAEKDPLLRMRACRDLVARGRRQPANDYMDLIATSINALPPALLGPFAARAARSNDLVASCVPGVGMPLYLAGSQVEALYTFGPLAGAAANATLFSYLDLAHVSFSTDPAAIPDQTVLLACMRQGFSEVIAVA